MIPAFHCKISLKKFLGFKIMKSLVPLSFFHKVVALFHPNKVGTFEWKLLQTFERKTIMKL